ncbi:unnamed protein product, partial [Mesorhabditis belari]|uniref:Ground-like domain-containing protein n=1 Tax=Mesorhabditis belari TaxID=2138241 RepID=A0AAF3EW72_9BILA
MWFLVGFLISTASAFLFGGGNSQCCPPCNPLPICAPQPICPPPPLCLPPPPTLPPISLPKLGGCCNSCGGCMKKVKRSIDEEMMEEPQEPQIEATDAMISRRERASSDDVVKVDAKCNSPELREIIINNMDRVTSVAKKRIQTAAEEELGARFNVICARGDFSYITNTELYCQQTVGDVTCYVFKQLSDIVRSKL